MTPKKILLDALMHLGDIIMSDSAVLVLKKAWPDAEITYLTYGNLAEAAALLEGVDRVIGYDYRSKGGYLDVYRMGKQLEKEQFDIAISLDPRERVTLMKWFANIPERVSMEQALGWKLGWEKYFYTKVVSLKGWDSGKHRMSESYQEIAQRYIREKSAGCAAPGRVSSEGSENATVFLSSSLYKNIYPPRFKPSAPEDLHYIEDLVGQFKGRSASRAVKWVTFCVETTGKHKDWRAERFSKLADHLIEQDDAVIIMTGIPEHQAKIQAVIAGMKHKESVMNLCGKTTLRQLIALFRRTDLLISLDTGTAHIAAAAGCPVVTIFSHSSPEIYQAAGINTRAVSAHLPCSGKKICIGPRKCERTDCFDFVTVDMVLKAAEELLNKDDRYK